MNIQKTLNVVIIAAWFATGVLGWTQARWPGLFTGLFCYSVINQLVLFALGHSAMLRPAETIVGQVQRKWAWPFIGVALAGAYYGGWRWGWFWCVASYGAVAIPVITLAARRQRHEVKQQHGRLINSLAEATARRRRDGAANDHAEFHALVDILNAIESAPKLVAVISRHAASRERLQNLYLELTRADADPPIAAASLLNPVSLDYLLYTPNLPVERRVKELAVYFEGGHLTYVSGAIDITDTSAESKEAGDAVPGAKPVAGPETTALKRRSAPGPREPWWRRFNPVARAFNGICWAVQRRKLDALASEGRYDELIVAASATNTFARRFLGSDDPPSLAYLADAHLARGDYAEARRHLERAVEAGRSTYELLSDAGKKKTGRLFPADGTPVFEYAQGLRGLAELNFAIGDFKGAERIARETVSLFESAADGSWSMGDEQIAVTRQWAEAMDMLGDALLNQDEPKKAEPVYRGALRLREERFGKGHLETARSYLNLGTLLRSIGQYAAVGPLVDHAVHILENIPRQNASALAEALLQQGIHFQDTGEYARAGHNCHRRTCSAQKRF